jgi:hypothetical protein
MCFSRIIGPLASRLLLTASMLMGGLTFGALGQEIKIPTERTPIPELRALQDRRMAEIEQLLKTALDGSRPIPERVSSIRSLGGVNFDFLLANARELVSDREPAVALTTIEVLGAQVAMLPAPGHPHGDNSGGDKLGSYQDQLVSEVLDFLRLAQRHSDLTVRSRASSILASRGDAQALASIQTMIDKGELPAKQGIGYLTLAPTNIASPFIEKYLTTKNPEIQAAAVAQLSYNPSYTEKVRNVALASDVNNDVLRSALPGLAATDSSFLTYAIGVTQNAKYSEEVRGAAVEEIVRVTLSKETDINKVRALVPALETSVKNLTPNSAAKDAVQGLKNQYKLQ